MTTHRHWTVTADEAQLVARLVEQAEMNERVAQASRAVLERSRERLTRYTERQAARIADGTIKVQTDVTPNQTEEIAS